MAYSTLCKVALAAGAIGASACVAYVTVKIHNFQEASKDVRQWNTEVGLADLFQESSDCVVNASRVLKTLTPEAELAVEQQPFQPKQLARRQGRCWGRRKPASHWLATELRAKFGLLKDNPANRQILTREALVIMRKKHVRASDTQHVLPMAIEWALTPTTHDVEAADYRRSLPVKLTKWWVGPEN